MPLGGYCTVCQRWVWLSPYGECQNGHPALAVKDVQQLKPQDDPDVLVGEVLDEGRPRARFRWWWRHSAWILWTFTSAPGTRRGPCSGSPISCRSC